MQPSTPRARSAAPARLLVLHLWLPTAHLRLTESGSPPSALSGRDVLFKALILRTLATLLNQPTNQLLQTRSKAAALLGAQAALQQLRLQR
jgi:formate hydrogenlyase subunit 3/multisubunit Na+/H+ antiporter MnhD subunit